MRSNNSIKVKKVEEKKSRKFEIYPKKKKNI